MRCQICKFATEMEDLGDKLSSMVNKITVEEIDGGTVDMPFTQRSDWLKSQRRDKAHQQLTWLIETSQLPEKKRTKNEHTQVKYLHNLYKKGASCVKRWFSHC